MSRYILRIKGRRTGVAIPFDTPLEEQERIAIAAYAFFTGLPVRPAAGASLLERMWHRLAVVWTIAFPPRPTMPEGLYWFGIGADGNMEVGRRLTVVEELENTGRLS